MWFGHGTKPKDSPVHSEIADAIKPLPDRIHDLGHVLVATVPASKRYHAAVRLDVADHARLDRVMTAVVRAMPLGPRLTVLRVFGTHPDAPGTALLVEAGRQLAGSRTNADLRAAADKAGVAIQQIGLDQFRPFLRKADDHLERLGGLSVLMHEVSQLHRGVQQASSERALSTKAITALRLPSADPQVFPAGSPTPTVPPPNNIPGGPWKWSANPQNGRGGTFVGPNGATANWDDLDAHWDVDDGTNNRTRYNRFGAPMTPDEAHGRYKGPPRIPLPFRIFRGLPPLFITPEQKRWILGEPESA